MRAFGADRVRTSAGKEILHSPISKGWTAHKPKTTTSAEFPGTAVLCEDRYYEVLSAELLPEGGVRYVLGPWPDDHAIRVFDSYDEESEARRYADYEKAQRQRRHSLAARIAGVFLGYLPAGVQEKLADELGLFPARMTILSIVPGLVLFGVCVFVSVGAGMDGKLSPIPSVVSLVATLLFLESPVRFYIAMSQNRGVGSVLGTLVYWVIWLITPIEKNLIPPFQKSKGHSIAAFAPSAETAAQDSLESRSWMLTFLTPAEQSKLARRYGYDYRRHATAPAWAIGAVGLLGVLSSLPKLGTAGGIGSLLLGGFIAGEQIVRLRTLPHRPAGSMFAVLVRPFVRDLLR